MRREVIRVKGTDLSIKELIEKTNELNIYEKDFFKDMFDEDADENDLALIHGDGFISEDDGYTIIEEEVCE